MENDTLVNWLLEDDNPSVKYFTLLEILGYSKDEKEMKKVQQEILQTGPVPKILAL